MRPYRVYVAGQFLRFVTPRQYSKKVAGKVLPPRANVKRGDREYEVRRVCEKKDIRGWQAWNCHYKEVEV